jgi:hypothetical protein
MRRHRPLDAHEIMGEPFLQIVEEFSEILIHVSEFLKIV